VKLETDMAFQMPDLAAVVGETARGPGQELRTAYFDTSDHRLWQREISLRHRTGEEPRGSNGGIWTVKLPTEGSGPTLDRTELSWSGDRDSVPAEARDLLRGIVRRSVLEQVTELVTTRRRLVLRSADGLSCGELDDDTVTVIGGRRDGLRFRELELELGSRGEAILDAVVDELRRAGARVGNEPKLAKALGLSGPSAREPADEISPRSSVQDLVGAGMAAAVERILDHDYRLRLDPLNPGAEDVHQARVAIRRLRSDLKTFGPLLDPVWLEHTRTELKWLGGVLGAVRDADVLGDHVGPDGKTDPPVEAGGRAELRRRSEEQRRTAVAELSRALTGDRYLDLLDRLQAAAGAAPTGHGGAGIFRSEVSAAEESASQVLPGLVRDQWRVLRRRVRKAGHQPSDRQLHRIRIGAKQLRYGAEMAVPVVGRAARRTAKAAERLQTVLGEHHDAVTTEAWFRRVALNATPAGAFSAGRLSAAESRRQRTLRRGWRRVWKDLDTTSRRRWMH
jgi:CHAD domain-containing protein